MSVLESFPIGVVSALVAAAIVFFTATWRSEAVRSALTAIASTFPGIGLQYAFPHGMEAEGAIKEPLKKAQGLRVFSRRGNGFQGDLFASVLEKTDGKRLHVQVLLPDATTAPERPNRVDYREHEMASFDRSFRHGTLRRRIETTLVLLQPYVEPGRFELRKYHTPHICRFILTDQFLFLTPYSKLMHGRHSRVYQFGRGDLYDMFGRFFSMVWEASHDRALEPLPK